MRVRSIKAALLLLLLLLSLLLLSLALLTLEEGAGVDEEVAAVAAATVGGAIGVGVLCPSACRGAIPLIRIPEPRTGGRGGTAAAA